MLKSAIRRSLYLLVAITFGIGLFAFLRPLPLVKATPETVNIKTGAAISLPWPSYGQAAFGAASYGLLASHGDQKPAPIASVAKIITALFVLQQKPLALNAQGPTITLDATDVGYYNYYYANDGSIAKVTNGEQISEYQALQALLLPSANNMADSLARWAFGSTDAYVTYANSHIKDLGLTQTTVGGPSGFSAYTTSTANDLVRLGIQALANPVIAQIVNQQSAVVPVAGEIHNVNWLLGADGVNGIKTGNTDQAGGCFLFSAKHSVNGQDITLVGAVMGAPDLNQAIKDAKPILESADSGFQKITAIKKGQILGSYTADWGATAQAVAANDVSLYVWRGQAITASLSLNNINGNTATDSAVGGLQITANGQTASMQALLNQKFAKPSLTWRIFRY